MAENEKKPQRRRWRRLLLGLLLVVLAGWWTLDWWREPEIIISPETTFLTGPLDADGNVDYAAALNEMASEGVTPENNAVVLLVQAMGPEWGVTEVFGPGERKARSLPSEFYKNMGISKPPTDGDYFVDLHDFCKTKENREDVAAGTISDTVHDQLDVAIIRPWESEQYPHLAEWLKQNEKPLELIAEASRRSRCHVPLESGKLLGRTAIAIDGFWCVIEAFCVRAMLRASAGDVEGACADVIAGRRLAALVRQHPTTFANLSYVILESVTCRTQRALVHFCDLPEEWYERLAQPCSDMPPGRSLAGLLATGTRFEALQIATTLARGADAELRREMEDANVREPHDWNDVLRQINGHFDHLVTAALEAEISPRLDLLRSIKNSQRPLTLNPRRIPVVHGLLDFIGVKHHGKQPTDPLDFCIPVTVYWAQSTSDTGKIRRDFARLALYLGAYRADHGQYPAKLADLVPDYLPGLPKDLYAPGPYRYRLTSEGCLLYSVGLNGQDDNGRNAMYEMDESLPADADDIPLHMPPKLEEHLVEEPEPEEPASEKQ